MVWTLYQVQTGSASTFLGDKILAAEIDYQEHSDTQGMSSGGGPEVWSLCLSLLTLPRTDLSTVQG